MKVLFLDIDNVLNTDKGISAYYKLTKHTDYIDPKLSAKLSLLFKEIPDLKIVISSAWRLYFPLKEISQRLSKHVPKDSIIDRTDLGKFSQSDHPSRGHNIARWIEINKPDSYVIIDDLDDGISRLHTNFVRINGKTGITDKDIKKIISLLKGEKSESKVK